MISEIQIQILQRRKKKEPCPLRICIYVIKIEVWIK